MECVGQSTEIGPVDGVRIARGLCVMNLKEMEFEIMSTPASRVSLIHLTPGGKHGKFSACPIATAIGSTQLALDQLMIAQRQLALSKRERDEYEALKLEVAQLRDLRFSSSSALPLPSAAPVPVVPIAASFGIAAGGPAASVSQRRTPPRMRQKVGSPRHSSPTRKSPTRGSPSPTYLAAQQKMLLSPVPRDMLSQQRSPHRSPSRSPPMKVFNNPIAVAPMPSAVSPVPISPTTRATRFSPVPVTIPISPTRVDLMAPAGLPLTSPVYDEYEPLPDSDEEASHRSLSPIRYY